MDAVEIVLKDNKLAVNIDLPEMGYPFQKHWNIVMPSDGNPPPGKAGGQPKPWKQTTRETLEDIFQHFEVSQKYNLPHDLQCEIIKLLKGVPNIDTRSAQRALIYSAGLDGELVEQLSFGDNLHEFCTLTIHILKDNRLLHDGRDSIEALIEAAKDSMGYEKKNNASQLIQQLREIAKLQETLAKQILQNVENVENTEQSILCNIYEESARSEFQEIIPKLHRLFEELERSRESDLRYPRLEPKPKIRKEMDVKQDINSSISTLKGMIEKYCPSILHRET